MTIGNVNNNFLNSITDAGAAQAKADETDFQVLLEKIRGAQEETADLELRNATEEFEAYYLNKVFTEMRKSVPKTGLMGNDKGTEYFEDMLYDAYAKEMAKGNGTGIKEMLYKQLKG